LKERGETEREVKVKKREEKGAKWLRKIKRNGNGREAEKRNGEETKGEKQGGEGAFTLISIFCRAFGAENR